MKKTGIVIALAVLAHSASAQTTGDKPKDVPSGIAQITVNARAINVFTPLRPMAHLSFIGGLDISSSAKGFGGFSALHFDASGTHGLAVSDAGLWMRFDLVVADGKPAAITHAELSPLHDAQGASIAGTPKGDAESLAIRDGDAFIGFEQTDAIRRFDLGKDGLGARANATYFPDDIKQLRTSRGLESLAVFSDTSRYPGALLAIAESPVKGEQNNRAWIIEDKSARRLSVVMRDGFQITDAAFLKSGTLLILERRFTPPFDLSMRMREISGAAISGGAKLDGEVLVEARLGAPIDNMEGLAVSTGADGSEEISLISDDNYNLFQRTLLMRFKYNAK